MIRDVLIVTGDTAEKETLLKLAGISGARSILCSSAREALQRAKECDFSMILIGHLDEGISGAELKKTLQNSKPDAHVVLLTRLGDAGDQGNSNYAIGAEDLRLLLLDAKASAKRSAADSPEQRGVKDFFINLTDLLVGILEVEDDFFSGNSHTVMHLSRRLAARMALPQDAVDAITLASLLRDIGKIGVKQQILNQSRYLTNDELLTVQDHCHTSLKLLKRVNLPWQIDRIILHHHERYDGTGYPGYLKGREIPLGSRILAVVDSFVAITTDRPHRAARNRESAMEEITRQAGTAYDPEIVQVFMKVVAEDWKWDPENRKRLLLVDDETYMLTLMKLHLVNEGFDVVTAENGDEAIKRIKEEKPDLIISDVVMPVMDGFTLRKVLSQEPALQDIPVIFLSSSLNPENRVKGLKLGAVDYITKPFDLEELSLKVSSLLQKESPAPKAGEDSDWIHGRLQDMPLIDIVQFLNLGLKTAQVNLYRQSGNATGTLFFTRGEVTAANTEADEGETAFFQMLRWGEGKFKIRHGVQSDSVNISKATMGLMMDGMKMIDEENRDACMEVGN
ncbi:MAG: response regulator [bacterium]|nr:response regulator [bacterium]